MNQTLRKQITREFPELAAGYHLPVMAEVLAVSDAPKQGGVNDSYRPRLAVNVVLLNSQFKSTDIFLDAVPMPIMGGGNERGFFAMPKKGTLVEVAWFYGSPERPFVRSVMGDRQALPWTDEHTMAWQQDESVKQTVDNSGNWKRETHADITDKSQTHFIETQNKIEILGEEIKRVLQHSIEDIDGKKQIEASAIQMLSASVANYLALGSVNTSAGEHITRSAAINIIDKALGDYESSAKNIKQTATDNIEDSAKNIKQTATGDFEMKAKKIHLGTTTDNFLKLVSDFMAAVKDGFTAASVLAVTCGKPGDPSVGVVNAAAFTGAATAISAVKTKVNSMTK